MKLRNLLLASLAVCTFASCSKDDNGPAVPQEVDAYLSIASISDLATKADPVEKTELGEEQERVISTLTAYVFTNDESNAYVIHKTVKATDQGAITEQVGNYKSVKAINGIHVKVQSLGAGETYSPTKFKVVLVANVEPGVVKDLAALKEKTTADITTFKTIGGHLLPMHSDANGILIQNIKPYSDEEHIQNWYVSGGCIQQTAADNVTTTVPTGAGTITLYRSIARVQIESLTSKFAGQYATATFKIDSIFLANARSVATLMGEVPTIDASPYYRGAPAVFTVVQGLIDPASTVKSEFLNIYPANDFSITNNKTLNAATIGFSKYLFANSTVNTTDGYQTRLVIAGDLYLGANKVGHKYFHIPLVNTGGNGNVVSNKIYKITATITGEGNPRPDEILDNACINFQITVEQWKVVDQKEEDIN